MPRNAASDDGRSNDVLLTKGSFTFFVAVSTTAGGEGGIRTHAPFYWPSALAVRPLDLLEYLSIYEKRREENFFSLVLSI